MGCSGVSWVRRCVLEAGVCVACVYVLFVFFVCICALFFVCVCVCVCALFVCFVICLLCVCFVCVFFVCVLCGCVLFVCRGGRGAGCTVGRSSAASGVDERQLGRSLGGPGRGWGEPGRAGHWISLGCELIWIDSLCKILTEMSQRIVPRGHPTELLARI